MTDTHRRRYSSDYGETVELRDAQLVRLRLLRRDDVGLLLRAFERLSDDSRYQRFFVAKRALTPEELRVLTDCDGENHLAIAALSARDSEGLGVARFIRVPDDPVVAEAAITVIDCWQRCGLGAVLLARLLAAAAERGVERLVLYALTENTAIVGLARKLAPDTAFSPAPQFGESVVRILLPVGAARASR